MRNSEEREGNAVYQKPCSEYICVYENLLFYVGNGTISLWIYEHTYLTKSCVAKSFSNKCPVNGKNLKENQNHNDLVYILDG